MKIKKDILEFFFGGDCHILRTTLRRILHLFLPIFFPLKKNRDKAKKTLDNWSFKLNKEKIYYFVSRYPKVRSESETIETIEKKSCSISRFGDGEFNLCIGRNIGFQKHEKELSSRLKKILRSKDEKILIAINTLPEIEQFSSIWKKFIIRRGNRVSRLFEKNRTYDSSTITTIFPKNSDDLKERVTKLKKIWEGRKVTFVVGKNSRFFLSRDLFDNIKDIEFIYGPDKNAFSEYNLLLKKITSRPTDRLILLALGPTATVLSYDLSMLGYQAIDIGHMPSKYHKQRYGTLYPSNFNVKNSKKILY